MRVHDTANRRMSFFGEGGGIPETKCDFLALALSAIINNGTISLRDNVPQMTITKIQK